MNFKYNFKTAGCARLPCEVYMKLITIILCKITYEMNY